MASVPIPKFATPCGALSRELRNRKDTSKSIFLVPLLNPKFANGLAACFSELRVRGTSGSRTIREMKVMSGYHRDKGDVTAAQERASRLADRALVPNVRYRRNIGDRLIAGDYARVE
jgi:hypothetical protein